MTLCVSVVLHVLSYIIPLSFPFKPSSFKCDMSVNISLFYQRFIVFYIPPFLVVCPSFLLSSPYHFTLCLVSAVYLRFLLLCLFSSFYFVPCLLNFHSLVSLLSSHFLFSPLLISSPVIDPLLVSSSHLAGSSPCFFCHFFVFLVLSYFLSLPSSPVVCCPRSSLDLEDILVLHLEERPKVLISEGQGSRSEDTWDYFLWRSFNTL